MPEQQVDDFAYFRIRIGREEGGQAPAALSGVVERIGTGEKRSFASGDELIRFMCGAGSPERSLPPGAVPRNDASAGSSHRKS